MESDGEPNEPTASADEPSVEGAALPEEPPSIPVTPVPIQRHEVARVSSPSLPPGASMIEIRSLTKRYGAVNALSGLDLTVREGEVYGFLGRNGAGKSTTIRILMGITQKTAGTVALFGEPAGKTDLVRARQRIGYVAQEQSFYGWMTPAALARFVRAFFPTWDEAEFRRLATVLEMPLDRKIGGFSGGMRVKVALAIALAHRPPLLLLDEPTAGLDPVARREFLELVKGETKRSGRTTFFSSHLVDEVELVAHRVGIVDAGRTRYEGSVRALSARVRLVSRSGSEAQELPMISAALTARGLKVLHTDAEDGTLRVYVEADDPSRFDALLAEPELGLTVSPLSLEEIFVAMVRRKSA